jgi:hypothetical protein
MIYTLAREVEYSQYKDTSCQYKNTSSLLRQYTVIIRTIYFGTGKRQAGSSLQSFRLAEGSGDLRVVGKDHDGPEDPDVLYRYCGGRR